MVTCMSCLGHPMAGRAVVIKEWNGHCHVRTCMDAADAYDTDCLWLLCEFDSDGRTRAEEGAWWVWLMTE